MGSSQRSKFDPRNSQKWRAWYERQTLEKISRAKKALKFLQARSSKRKAIKTTQVKSGQRKKRRPKWV